MQVSVNVLSDLLLAMIAAGVFISIGILVCLLLAVFALLARKDG
jgi:hypothetical protein